MKHLFLILVLLVLSGCHNLVYRTRQEAGGVPYCCTIPVAIQLGDAIAGPWNHSYMRYCEHYRAQFVLPWLIVDLPCEVVLDTIFLPFDLWK